MSASFVTLTICACLAVATADVSHLLPSGYLPPVKPQQVEHMSIEQHELRELPVQVDYMRDHGHGFMESEYVTEQQPSSEFMPPAMPEMQQMFGYRYQQPSAMPQAEQVSDMPATRYLPPASVPVPVPVMLKAKPLPAMPASTRYLSPAQPALPALEQMPGMTVATRYLPPAAPTQRAEPEPEPQTEMMMMPEPVMEYQAPVEPQAAPAMRYLPPAQQPTQPQYHYQQYQQQYQQEQQMPYVLDVQQPMAPSDAETLAYNQPEPEPAHELRNDGYHYKQANQEQRLRH